MSVFTLVCLLIILVIISLWQYGSYQRKSWSVIPEVRTLRATGVLRSSKTAVLVLTGAFNGPAHTEEIAEFYRTTVGDTYVVDYPLMRFSIRATMQAAYEKVASKSEYDRVIIAGYSLGGLIALHILQLAQRYHADFARKIELVLADVPLYPEHLRIPGGAAIPSWLMPVWLKIAPHAHRLHIGPLINLASSFVARQTFIPAPEIMREPGMDNKIFDRHMAFLLRNKLSTIVEQVAAMACHKKITPGSVAPVPVVYLQCGDGTVPDSSPDAPDKVIMGDAATTKWRELFPEMKHLMVGSKTMHVALVEAPNAWITASKEAVQLLDA